MSAFIHTGAAKFDEDPGSNRFSASVGSVHHPYQVSTSPSVQGVPLEQFGTNLIYRDVNELTSLNKV